MSSVAPGWAPIWRPSSRSGISCARRTPGPEDKQEKVRDSASDSTCSETGGKESRFPRPLTPSPSRPSMWNGPIIEVSQRICQANRGFDYL